MQASSGQDAAYLEAVSILVVSRETYFFTEVVRRYVATLVAIRRVGPSQRSYVLVTAKERAVHCAAGIQTLEISASLGHSEGGLRVAEATSNERLRR